MIARLAGLLDWVGEDRCIIDVGGVGYLVFCGGRTLRRLPRPGEAVKLWIETHVREDHIHLYGFLDEAEQRWFQILQTVQGVGARVALNILAALAPVDLARAIAAGDKAMLTQADGVGAKLAARLVTELKDKVGDVSLGPAAGETGVTPVPAEGATEDAISALVNLGYKRIEAFGAVAKAARELGERAEVSALIRGGLKELAR